MSITTRCLISLLLLLSHYQLTENGGPGVEAKVRNRVQKWQQRTWRARFGSTPRKDWKSAFEPEKSSHRRHYGLSPREDDFFTSDTVPNAYSQYHYRRYGDTRFKGHRKDGSSAASPASSPSRGRRPTESGSFGAQRPKRLAGPLYDPAPELKDYLDPVDLMLLGDDPNVEFVPIGEELAQRYGPEQGLEQDTLPDDETTPEAKDKQKTKEFKIVFHHRNPHGNRGNAIPLSMVCVIVPMIVSLHVLLSVHSEM
ncbi:hypothetical protein AND_005436 [Anopheles darlingi]|uniref:Secreted protein n=1 Tax=Anopheles darlingi TaxID=43151 RepID=W5JFM6_ANODA|nr:hypothetical protein AND_005436 [Anopheles darlingi]